MRKIISFVLALCLMLGATSALAGCGAKFDGLVVGFLRYSDVPELPHVEKAVSDYVNEKLGFKVKFKPVDIMNQTIYTNWIAAKEQLDVMPMLLSSPATLIASKQARELDSLLTEENAPHLLDLIEERDDFTITDSTGAIYGLGTIEPSIASSGGYIIKEEVLEELGLLTTAEAKEPDKYYDGMLITLDDLDPIFAAIKANMKTTAAGRPVYACGNLPSMSTFQNAIEFDDLGDFELSSGVLMDITSSNPQVTNFWKSNEYKHYVQKMGEWHDKGYIHQDAATTQESLTTLMTSGQFVGLFSGGVSLKAGNELEHGPMVQLNFTEYSYKYSQNQMPIMIPSTSKRPVDAIKFLNLLMEDEYFMNMFFFGVEGRHWEYISKDARLVRIKQLAKDGYAFVFGVGGDRRLMYDGVVEGYMEDDEAIEHFTKVRAEIALENVEAEKRPSVGVGFVYNPGRLAPTIKSLKAVIAKYDSILRVGKGGKNGNSYTGSGTQYDKFIKELDSAGMQSVIDHKNSQFQEWFAAKSAS